MAKLISISNRLGMWFRNLITDAGGATCCCPDTTQEYVYFADCCDGFPVIKMTVEHYLQYVEPIDCIQGQYGENPKWRFAGYNECFYECTINVDECRRRYPNPDDIRLLPEAIVSTVECVPYVNRENGGLPNNCDSLPRECPECEPVDCCIRRFHALNCDEWVGANFRDPNTPGYRSCNYGTSASIYRFSQTVFNQEWFRVLPGTRIDTWPPDWPRNLIWCVLPTCIPEQQTRFQREIWTRTYDGTCQTCYRDDETNGEANVTNSYSRSGYQRNYCTGYDPAYPPPSGPCTGDYNGDCLRFTEDDLSGSSYETSPAAPCDFSGPPIGNRIGDCTNGPSYERLHDGCVITEIWRTLDYEWSCGGATKVYTERVEIRHAERGPDDPNVLCWPPYDGYGIDSTCPAAVGKLIYRSQYTLTDRVGVSVRSRTAYYGTCAPDPPNPVNAPIGGRTRVRSGDLI